jgi:hypothetical protein
MIFSATNIGSWMKTGSSLPDKDISGFDNLTTEALNT